jgi:hypothetical protein
MNPPFPPPALFFFSLIKPSQKKKKKAYSPSVGEEEKWKSKEQKRIRGKRNPKKFKIAPATPFSSQKNGKREGKNDILNIATVLPKIFLNIPKNKFIPLLKPFLLIGIRKEDIREC